MRKRLAVVSAILENAKECQAEFNSILADYQEYIYGRMGIPFHKEGVSVIAISFVASMDTINAFTGKLGRLPQVQVKCSISKKGLEE